MSYNNNRTRSQKKLGKYCNLLKKQYGILPSDTPQKNIMWCNGGIAAGISMEEVVKFFSKFGIVENVYLMKKKSYAFITFKDVKYATVCYEMSQGKCLFQQLNGPMHFLYVNKVPDMNIEQCSSNLPPGARLCKDFVSAEEELNLLDYMNSSESNWRTLKQRNVKHFGHEFVYEKNCAIRTDGILEVPSVCNSFWKRITKLGIPLSWIPDQLTVNKYDPGQGIPPHIDTHSIFEDTIFIVSLGSDVQMEFRNENSNCIVPITRRSLLVLSGESRYAWTHGISSRVRDVHYDNDLGYYVLKRGTRMSLTFRRVRNNKPCNCNFTKYCDSRITESDELFEDCAVQLESKYVKETYLNIADHFSQTRYKPWKFVMDFINLFMMGSLVLDVGCGNGKYFGLNSNIFEIGSELCSSLAEICFKRGFQVVNNDCLSLPFKDNIFDGVICIAVLHHLSTFKRRQNAMSEIVRVLKADGKALVYVWAEEQMDKNTQPTEQQEYEWQPDGPSIGTNVVLNSNVALPIVANNGKNFNRKDILVPWRSQTEDSIKSYLRYYHIFDENELQHLCKSAGGSVLNTYYDTGNWCIKFTKQV